MKKYPEHSVVRIHTATLEKIKKLSKDNNIRPPKLIDMVVDYFIANKEREEK